jgi:hypothetical protein
MSDASEIDKGDPLKTEPRRRVSLGRPKWTNIALIVSLLVFWAGVLLKFLT